MRSEKDKMLAGELYDASAPEIQAELAATHRWLARYNAALYMASSDRHTLLRERLATVGDGAVIRPPFHCDYGFNISLGAGAFLNFNCDPGCCRGHDRRPHSDRAGGADPRGRPSTRPSSKSLGSRIRASGPCWT